MSACPFLSVVENIKNPLNPRGQGDKSSMRIAPASARMKLADVALLFFEVKKPMDGHKSHPVYYACYDVG